MPLNKTFSALLLGACIYSTSAFGPVALTGLTAHAQTRSATVLPIASSDLNSLLEQALKKEFSDVSFHIAGAEIANPEPFLKALKKMSIPTNGISTVTIGSTEVPSADAKALAKSQFVLAPRWSFAPVKFTGPHLDTEKNWSIHAESELTLSLSLFSMQGKTPKAAGEEKVTFNLVRLIPINDMPNLLKVIKESTGTDVDLGDAKQKAFVIEVVRQIPSFKEIEKGSPSETFLPLAKEQITALQLNPLIKKLKANKDINKVSGIQSVNQGKIIARLETPPHYDQGFDVLRQGRNIGFAKVRGIQGDTIELQTILSSEPFAAGDTLKPRSDIGLDLRLVGGSSSLGLGGPPAFPGQLPQPGFAPVLFVPQGQLQVGYNLGQFMPFPEFYLTFNGGAMAPSQGLALTQPIQPGFGIPGGNLGLNQLSSVFAYSTELGVEKRFYFGSFYLSAAARGGMLGGVFMNAVLQQNPAFPAPTPMAFAFGGTALVGGHYQITPGFDIGLDAGFRYFDGGSWMLDSGFGLQPYPQIPNVLQSIGPVLHLSAGYQF